MTPNNVLNCIIELNQWLAKRPNIDANEISYQYPFIVTDEENGIFINLMELKKIYKNTFKLIGNRENLLKYLLEHITPILVKNNVKYVDVVGVSLYQYVDKEKKFISSLEMKPIFK